MTATASGDGPHDPDLEEMARDELRRAIQIAWKDLAKVTPWGDTFEGISPAGRQVLVERSYIWADEPGGDVLCEVVAYVNAPLYDQGARVGHVVARPAY